MRLALVIVLIGLLPLAYGASVSGIVYDLSLDTLENSIVTINTVPEQRMVAKDGTYAFTVPEGTYVLTAEAQIDDDPWKSSEEVTIAGDGSYTLDLILEPSFDDVNELAFEDIDLDQLENDSLLSGILIAIGVLAIIGVWIFYSRMMRVRAPKNIVEDDEYRQAVLAILKKHKGRVTQRALRKELPFSEAKVSLVLTELESEGKIKKIKKGRGNVIVFI